MANDNTFSITIKNPEGYKETYRLNKQKCTREAE
jgi:hypothetical protein